MKTKKALSFILSAGMFLSGMTCAVPSAVSAEEEQTSSYSQDFFCSRKPCLQASTSAGPS